MYVSLDVHAFTQRSEDCPEVVNVMGLETRPSRNIKRKDKARRLSRFAIIKATLVKGSARGLEQGGIIARGAAIDKKNNMSHSSMAADGSSGGRQERYQSSNSQEERKKAVVVLTIALCVIFFILKTFQPFILDLSRDKDSGSYPFRPTTTIWFSRVILLVFFLIWCYADNEEWSWSEWKRSVPFVVVGLCTVSNVLAIYLTIEYLGSGAYSVLKNANLPFTAVLMVTWAKKHISIVQWTCVAALTLGLMIYRADALVRTNSLSIGYVFLLVGVVASSVEGIVMQQTSTKMTDISFPKQSFYYHLYSFILSTIVMVVWDYDVVFYANYGPFQGWNYLVGVYIICIVPLVVIKHAVAGLASAIVVKLIVSATTVSSFILAVGALNESATVVEILSCMLICVLLVTYQMGGDLTAINLILKNSVPQIQRPTKFQNDKIFKVNGRDTPSPKSRSLVGRRDTLSPKSRSDVRIRIIASETTDPTPEGNREGNKEGNRGGKREDEKKGREEENEV